MRRVIAATAVAGLLAAAPPAHADPRISVRYDDGCFFLLVEAFVFPLFCVPPAPGA